MNEISIKELDEANELKNLLLTEGKEVIENVLNRAKGKSTNQSFEPQHEEKVWNAIIPIISDAKEIPELTGIDEGTLTDRINCIFSHVAGGLITIEQAQSLIKMLKDNEH